MAPRDAEFIEGGAASARHRRLVPNTVCARRDGACLAALSTTVGDLNTPAACAGVFDQACDEMRVWLQAPPAALACDLHPDFYSSRMAASLASELGFGYRPAPPRPYRFLCAEHGRGPVSAWRSTAWGWHRRNALGRRTAAWMAPATSASGHPFAPSRCRAATAPGSHGALRRAFFMPLGRGAEITLPLRRRGRARTMLVTMLAKRLNCPETSSAGRVFDAAAGLLGISRRMSFEAEGPSRSRRRLRAMSKLTAGQGPAEWRIADDGQLDLIPPWAGWPSRRRFMGAAVFHATLPRRRRSRTGQPLPNQRHRQDRLRRWLLPQPSARRVCGKSSKRNRKNRTRHEAPARCRPAMPGSRSLVRPGSPTRIWRTDMCCHPAGRGNTRRRPGGGRSGRRRKEVFLAGRRRGASAIT